MKVTNDTNITIDWFREHKKLEATNAELLLALETIANRLRLEPHYIHSGMVKVADEAIRNASA